MRRTPGEPTGRAGGERTGCQTRRRHNAPSKAGVVFQNAALARSPAEPVLGLSLRLAYRAGPASDILLCAPGP